MNDEMLAALLLSVSIIEYQAFSSRGLFVRCGYDRFAILSLFKIRNVIVSKDETRKNISRPIRNKENVKSIILNARRHPLPSFVITKGKFRKCGGIPYPHS